MTPPSNKAVDGPIYVFGEPMVELSSVVGDSARIGVGGDTFNTSVYLARAGVHVEYVTAVGDDPMSQRVIDALSAEGVGTKHVSIIPGKPVGLYAISLDDEGERSFTYWRSTSAFRSWFSAENAAETLAAMGSAPMLYLSGITLSVFSDEERAQIVGLTKTVRENGGRVAFDTNYRPAGWQDADVARAAIELTMPNVSIALPTFEDDENLFGVDTPEDCINTWLGAGASEVCVKVGPKGALLSNNGWVSPPAPLRPKDTTGAGDSFNGAYIAARLLGHDTEEAAARANDLAGQVIMTNGAIIPRG